MPVIAAQLIAEVKSSGIEETKRQLDEVGKQSEKTKEHFKGLKDAFSTAAGFAIFGGAMAGIGFLKDQVGDIIKVTSEFQQTQAQTTNVIRSMHDASGQTADQIHEMAVRISEVAPVSADAEQAGENMLMTFGNIGKKTFPEATQAVTDFAYFMKMDVSQAALQVGKALNDPATGMANLQREGVRLSPQLQETVKHLEKMGDMAGAQKIVLQELEREFGGSAEAAGKTFGGQLAILGNQFDEIKIKIGSALLPILSDLLNKYVVPLAEKFQDWMLKGGGLNDFKQWMKDAVNILETYIIPDFKLLLNDAIIPLASAFNQTFIQSGFLSGVLQTLQNIFTTVVPLIGRFVGWMEQGSAPARLLGDTLKVIGITIAGMKVLEWAQGFVQGLKEIATQSGLTKLAVLSDAGEEKAALGAEGVAGDANAAVNAVSGIGPAALGLVGPLGLLAGSLVLLGLVIKNDYETWQANVAAGYNMKPNTGNGRYDVNARNPNAPGYIMGGLNAGIHSLPTHGHASGILNNPQGHWATVGEQGPEMMYVPSGASILPNGMMPPASGSGGNGNTAYLQIDGVTLARLMMPYIADQLRNNLPIYGA